MGGCVGGAVEKQKARIDPMASIFLGCFIFILQNRALVTSLDIFNYINTLGKINVFAVYLDKKNILYAYRVHAQSTIDKIFSFWDFRLQVFLWIRFLLATEYPIRPISNFYENSRRYSKVKINHRR